VEKKFRLVPAEGAAVFWRRGRPIFFFDRLRSGQETGNRLIPRAELDRTNAPSSRAFDRREHPVLAWSQADQ